MDVGLGNLGELKAQLLAESLRAQTTFDAQVTAIGKGVLGMFETRCNRRFKRVANEQDIFSADRAHWILRRYPVEAVASVSTNDGSGFVQQTEVIDVLRQDNGVLKFNSRLGSDALVVQVVYTGGYWFQTAESGGDPQDVQPPASTTLPDDLKLAWFIQCQHVWTLRDKLGQLEQGSNAWAANASVLATMELVPSVESILRGYIRFAIT